MKKISWNTFVWTGLMLMAFGLILGVYLYDKQDTQKREANTHEYTDVLIGKVKELDTTKAFLVRGEERYYLEFSEGRRFEVNKWIYESLSVGEEYEFVVVYDEITNVVIRE